MICYNIEDLRNSIEPFMDEMQVYHEDSTGRLTGISVKYEMRGGTGILIISGEES